MLLCEARWCSWLAYGLLRAATILKKPLDLLAGAHEMASPQEKQ